MTNPAPDEDIFAGQSELYQAVAQAYRNAHAIAAEENACRQAAARAVRSAHPFLLQDEADRLARRIVSQFCRLYPEWFAE